MATKNIPFPDKVRDMVLDVIEGHPREAVVLPTTLVERATA